jgi:hypothetical protein
MSPSNRSARLIMARVVAISLAEVTVFFAGAPLGLAPFLVALGSLSTTGTPSSPASLPISDEEEAAFEAGIRRLKGLGHFGSAPLSAIVSIGDCPPNASLH